MASPGNGRAVLIRYGHWAVPAVYLGWQHQLDGIRCVCHPQVGDAQGTISIELHPWHSLLMGKPIPSRINIAGRQETDMSHSWPGALTAANDAQQPGLEGRFLTGVDDGNVARCNAKM